MGLKKLALVILLFWLVDDGTAAISCVMQNTCVIGSTCTANDLAGTSGTTQTDSVCYTAVTSSNGNINLFRASWTGSCSDLQMCGPSSSYTNSFWMQCCSSGNKCNNISLAALTAGIPSLASLEQCYLGLTASECNNPSSVLQSGCPLIGTTKRTTAATTTPIPAGTNCLKTTTISTLISSAEHQVNGLIVNRQAQNQAAQAQILQALNATLISQLGN